MKKKKKRKTKLRIDQGLLFFAIGLFLLFYPGENRYVYSGEFAAGSSLKEDPVPDFAPSPYPVRRGLYPQPEISARAAYLLDPASGAVLFEKNSSLKLPPASTAKLLTALVSLDAYDLDNVLTVKNIVTEGKTMDLFYGEEMGVENLLYGALVHSANDAAYVLADNYPGGVDAFVDEMNKKAAELGMENSRFTNPAGYDNGAQHITARDLAILSNYVLNQPTLSHMVGTKSITVADASYRYFHYLENVNELLGEIPGVAGVKTGYTALAGENLATLIKRDDREIIVVVLKSGDRFEDTRALIAWAFNEFEWDGG